MNYKFLVDECLSAGLAAIAKQRGLSADFGPHIGKAGWQDWNLAAFALEHDYTIVTHNRRDFLKLYAKISLHPGLVVIIPAGARAQQISWFESVLDYLEKNNVDLTNGLLEVDHAGLVRFRPWSSDDHDRNHVTQPDWK